MITKRGKAVLWILAILASLWLGYATADICYVGQPNGNMFGYGSCEKMIDDNVKK